MRDLVEPEIKACITTLNNIESEMGFFHAYQTRALQIAKSIVGESIQNSFDKDEKDAGYSKEMIQRDIDALRSQLDSLAELTSPDGEFARKLNFPRLSIARMTPSRASYGTRGPTAEISQRDPLAAMQSSSSTEEMASVQSSPLSEAASVRPAGGHLIKGCVVEVQNLPVNDLPGTHVSAALSVMPMSADPDEFEHVLPGRCPFVLLLRPCNVRPLHLVFLYCLMHTCTQKLLTNLNSCLCHTVLTHGYANGAARIMYLVAGSCHSWVGGGSAVSLANQESLSSLSSRRCVCVCVCVFVCVCLSVCLPV
jgi:hypothetical protein